MNQDWKLLLGKIEPDRRIAMIHAARDPKTGMTSIKKLRAVAEKELKKRSLDNG